MKKRFLKVLLLLSTTFTLSFFAFGCSCMSCLLGENASTDEDFDAGFGDGDDWGDEGAWDDEGDWGDEGEDEGNGDADAENGIVGLVNECMLYQYEDITLSAVLVESGEETDESIEWESSNEDVATVDENGKVTAYEAGTVEITASSGDYSKTCVITVNEKNGDPQLIVEEKVSIMYTETYQLSAYVLYNGKQYFDMEAEYQVADDTIVSVDETGLIEAIGNGETTVTVSATWRGLSGLTLTESVTVTANDYINFAFTNTEVQEIFTTNKDLGDGNTYTNQVTYGLTIKDNDTVVSDTASYVWKSTNTDAATVANGVVTGVGEGDTEIYVEYTADDGSVYTSDKLPLTVTTPVLTKNLNLKLGALDSWNELLSTTVFTDGSTIKKITDITGFTKLAIEYNTSDGRIYNLSEHPEQRTRTWKVSNGEYAYAINVFVATRVIRKAQDFGLVFSNYGSAANGYQGNAYYTTGTGKDAYYILGNNIDASSYVQAHGGQLTSAAGGLQGTFDGMGYSVKGMTIGASGGASGAGIFGHINGGTLKNVAFIDVKFATGATEVYGLAKYLQNAKIDNVYLEVSQLSNSAWSGGGQAGIAYKVAYNNTITNTMVVMTATATPTSYALIGHADAATKCSYQNVFVISQHDAAPVAVDVTQYADETTFDQKVDLTSDSFVNFNATYWDLTGAYPQFVSRTWNYK